MRRILALLSVVLVALTLVACAGGGGTFSGTTDESGAYVVTADGADKGSSVGSIGGGIQIKEGQQLSISSDLSSGKVVVKLLDGAADDVLEAHLTGTTKELHDLESGEYSVGATSEEAGTTGTVRIEVVSK